MDREGMRVSPESCVCRRVCVPWLCVDAAAPVSRCARQLIESGDPQAFRDYLRRTENTICGRHPICVRLLHVTHARVLSCCCVNVSSHRPASHLVALVTSLPHVVIDVSMPCAVCCVCICLCTAGDDGGCHCGTRRLDVPLPPLRAVVAVPADDGLVGILRRCGGHCTC
jgi:hypothetical protein